MHLLHVLLIIESTNIRGADLVMGPHEGVSITIHLYDHISFICRLPLFTTVTGSVRGGVGGTAAFTGDVKMIRLHVI